MPIRHFIIIFLGVLQANMLPCLAVQWTWEECLQKAVQNNAALAQAQENVQASMHELKAAYAGYLPELFIRSQMGYGPSHLTVQLESHLLGTLFDGNGSEYFRSNALVLTQNLFSGFADSARLKRAENNLIIAQANLSESKAQLGWELKSAFIEVLYGQEFLSFTKEIIERRQTGLHRTELLFQGGRESKPQVLLSEAYLNQAKIWKNKANHTINISKIKIKKVLNVQELEDVDIKGEIPLVAPMLTAEISALILQTPDFKRALAQEELARAHLQLATAPFFPRVDLHLMAAEYGGHLQATDRYSGLLFELQGLELQPGKLSFNNSRIFFGFDISFPLFNSGRDYYHRQAALSQLLAAGHQKRSMNQTSFILLTECFQAYLYAVENLEIEEKLLQATQMQEKIAREGYLNGIVLLENLNAIENELIARKKSFIEAKKERMFAQAKWEQVTGTGAIHEINVYSNA